MKLSGVCGGKDINSHGTNLSKGVAILFSSSLDVVIVNTEEPVKGCLILVEVKIQGMLFFLINIYSQTVGQECLNFFNILTGVFKKCSSEGYVVIGGDWNCTVNFAEDRNTEEPHIQSSGSLSKLIKDFKLFDMWRIKHPTDRQYTWVKAFNNSQCCPVGQILCVKMF